ncbi:hypothetical protein [Asticcacaulis machinosus]|uniref:Uncharacterized protein n=1 Tax=Asticcacaulis machinosus TaxID=2984211 RepID=A0ABT5HIF3_9CAUL|nr:hypothetical protein [Asticcacaulis machinosus]MDC7675384.1 hypothetical protein [Asticcacaulis machinosus]
MKTTIGKYDADNGHVPVVFVHAGVTHNRTVNAVMKDGQYDAVATKARVAEVAAGVEVKINTGVIRNPPPESPPAA